MLFWSRLIAFTSNSLGIENSFFSPVVSLNKEWYNLQSWYATSQTCFRKFVEIINCPPKFCCYQHFLPKSSKLKMKLSRITQIRYAFFESQITHAFYKQISFWRLKLGNNQKIKQLLSNSAASIFESCEQLWLVFIQEVSNY